MKRQRSRTCSNQYQSLEVRKMFAGVTIEVINDLETLVIDGTSEDDVAIVRDIGDNQIEVEFTTNADLMPENPPTPGTPLASGSSTSTAIIDRADIERIRFLGRGADDTFINNTDIDSAAFGHDGDDELRGGSGHNWIQGGNGNDRIFGGSRNDLLRGRNGNDFIDAGKRHDRVFGGAGDDVIVAGAGNDFVQGERGDDTVWGGNGQDRLAGGHGNNHLLFGNGFGDVALYDQVFGDTEITNEDEGVWLVQTSFGEDLIEDVASLRFSDQTVLPAEPIISLSEIEQESLRLVNFTRRQNGLAEVEVRQDLTQYAGSVAQQVLAPLGPNPSSSELFDSHSTIEDIAHLVNEDRVLYLENFSYLSNQDLTTEAAAQMIHDSFLQSPSHRANMLNEDATEIGIGIFKNANGWYVTHSFFATTG